MKKIDGPEIEGASGEVGAHRRSNDHFLHEESVRLLEKCPALVRQLGNLLRGG